MPTPTRTLYASQNAIILPNSGHYVSGANVWASVGITGTAYALAINSVSLDITNPVEDVLQFGTLGSAARVQKEPSKTKISLKSYLTSGNVSSFGGAVNFGASAISTLTGNALAGTYSKIIVEPYGFTGYGILSNLSLDASSNNFVMLDLTFEGLGSPDVSNPASSISSSAYSGSLPVFAVNPITSDKVGVSGTCVSSAKFSLDIPTDVITCLGSVITGEQSVVAAGNLTVAKPPFKTSISLEGTSASQDKSVDFGTILVNLPNGILVSQSINQAVGNVGMTYNYTIEDITATFADSTIATLE